MKLEEIQKEWAGDCKPNKDELDNESLKTPELHNKYWKIYSRERMLKKKLELEHKVLVKNKKEYYCGELSQEELASFGWEQFDLIVLKSDLSLYMDSDNDIIESKMKIHMQAEKVDYLESILQSLNGRSFIIKNAIDFLKFTNGQF